MNTRTWALVAVFAFLLVGVGVWAMWSSEPSTGPSAHAGDVPSPRSPFAASDVPRGPVRDMKPVALPGNNADRVRGKIPVSQTLMRERVLSMQANAAPKGGFTVDEAGVRAALASRANEIGACWQAARAHDPNLAASRTLQIEVAPGDNGGGATVSWVNSGAEMLDTCVGNALTGVGFAATEPTTLRYPMTFQ